MNARSEEALAIARELEALAALARRTADELAAPIAELAAMVNDTLEAGGKILFCGNGGSAADAQHIAAEYVVRFSRERRALAALALTTDTSVLTAEANDHGYETVFSRQIDALGAEGDLLVMHSTSGESENLLLAADAARAGGIRTVALLAKGGGRLEDRVDLALVVATDVTARAQELHLAMEHIVCGLVDRAMMESD